MNTQSHKHKPLHIKTTSRYMHPNWPTNNSMAFFEIVLALFSLLFLFYHFFHEKNELTNWPLVGMLPALLKNHHRIHDFFYEIIDNSTLTYFFQGPWFTNMSLLATVNPANVHYVFSKNFLNYPKGPKSMQIFEVLGNGIFNTDSDLWQYHRKMAQSFLALPQFNKFLVNKFWEKVEIGLIPTLDNACELGLEIDLQDLFERMTFDTITTIVMDYDPKTLSIDLPDLPSSKALCDIESAILFRHVVPTCVWKFQRWLGIGEERGYKEGWEVLDDFVYGCISKKREEMRTRTRSPSNEIGVDLITLYIEEEDKKTTTIEHKDKFLRDTFLNFIIAGRDTTSTTLSWFFYLLSRNPEVLSRIKEELSATIPHQHEDLSRNFEEIKDKLVYLHATLCETLRLYPPVAFETKTPIEPDTLPSGHKVDPNTQIVFSLYAMGRMKLIWGEDASEFKPERWITERGALKHEPSYKFFAFNAGPRTCVGKNMAFTQMKIAAAAIITKYDIQPVEGHLVIPDVSIILHMKHGFKVNIKSIEK